MITGTREDKTITRNSSQFKPVAVTQEPDDVTGDDNDYEDCENTGKLNLLQA